MSLSDTDWSLFTQATEAPPPYSHEASFIIKIDVGSHILFFRPKPDITPLEAAMLGNLWMSCLTVQGGVDCLLFIVHNGLQRHFVIVDRPSIVIAGPTTRM